MIFGDKMCNNAIQIQQQANIMANENSHVTGNLVDPFSFSALHFLRAYNKLLTPADLSQCYNFSPTSTSSANFAGFQNMQPLPPLETILPNKILQLPSSTSSNDSNTSSSLIVDIEKPKNKPESVNFISTSSNPKNLGNMGHVDSQERSTIYINKPYLFSRRQRGEKRPIPDEQKDGKYFERRKRNNEAAKKSRDARKMREDRIALRAALLEQENSILRAQTIALKEELFTLRQILCTRSTNPQISNI